MTISRIRSTIIKNTGQDSVLTGTGQAFIDAGEAVRSQCSYLAAHAIHESGFGTSDIFDRKK